MDENPNEHICPTCGREDFDSRRALGVHHSTAHDQKLPSPTVVCEICGDEFEVKAARQDEARYCSRECQADAKRTDHTEIECETCGDVFEVPPSQVEKARFCSSECRQENQRQAWTGKENPRWKGGSETIVCEQCGDEFDVKPVVADRRRFCSEECKGRAYAEERVGDGNPRWKEYVTLTCEQCGDEFDVKPSHASMREHCSMECKAETWATLTGQDNPNWGGGENLREAVRKQISSESWNSIRDRETADQCCVCGTDEDLHLHHIIPLMRGGTNEAWNLLTLCRTHHTHADAFTKNCSPLALLPEAEQ